MNVAELFIQCLEKEGVTKVFGVPGEENEDILFALADSKTIEFIPCRHEQGAAFIANVWGRLSGKAGVCLATLGPGATNLITGIADANLDKSPVVVITAQGDLNRLHHESHQLLDIVNMFKPITKWNVAIQGPEVVPEVIRKAFKIAQLEKPGATHIELSEDIAKEKVPAQLAPLNKGFVRRPAPEKESIEKVVELLRTAKRPLILAGNGAIRARVNKVLSQFVQKTNMPLIATFMGKGAISDKLPQSLLAMGLGFKDYVMQAIEKADCVLTIGYDIAEYAPEEWNPKADKKIIHLDFEAAEVYQHYIPTVELVGDITLAIKAIARKLGKDFNPAKKKAWYTPIRNRILKDIKSYDLKTGDNLTVPGTLNILRSMMEDDDLVISDVGAHKMWIARNYPCYCPNGCIISNGLASMGISLPGGIAGALLNGNRRVVSLMGDGGALMNIQELETAKRLGISYTVIVFNDNDYGLISWKQERSANRTAGTTISNPDFVKLGESFGWNGYRPTTVADLKKVLEDCLNNKQLNLIEIPIDASVNQALVQKLKNFFEKK